AVGGWGVDPVVEIRDPATLRMIESLLQAVLGPFVLLVVATNIVPRYKLWVCGLLGLMILVGMPLASYLLNHSATTTGSGVRIEYGLSRILANLIGVGFAFWITWFKESKR